MGAKHVLLKYIQNVSSGTLNVSARQKCLPRGWRFHPELNGSRALFNRLISIRTRKRSFARCILLYQQEHRPPFEFNVVYWRFLSCGRALFREEPPRSDKNFPSKEGSVRQELLTHLLSICFPLLWPTSWHQSKIETQTLSTQKKKKETHEHAPLTPVGREREVP